MIAATNGVRGNGTAARLAALQRRYKMLREIIRELLVFVGAMTVLVALAGIVLNCTLQRNWYGETEEQKRRRIRRERAELVPRIRSK